MSQSADDLLMGGGGAPTATFPTIGTTHKGTVLSKEAKQQIDPATKKPKTYDDGNPMMQVVITLQTDVRDPQINDDDGQRRVFAKGAMLAAIRDAVRAAGADTLEIGATLAVRYTGDGERKSAGMNPPKLFAAQVARPTTSVSSTDLI